MKKRKAFLALLLCLALITAAITAVTVARFQALYEDEPQAISPAAFYFEADLEEGETYFVAEGQDLVFTVRNHDTLSHVTAGTLSFQVAVNGTAVGSYTCTAGAAENKTVTVPAATLGAAGSIKQLTLSSTAPYTKTVTCNIEVIPVAAANTYSVTDKGDYVQLDLYVGSTLPTSDITIHYAGLAPDSTADLTASWTTAGSGTIAVSSLTPYARYTLYFFGTKAVTPVTNAPLGSSITLG